MANKFFIALAAAFVIVTAILFMFAVDNSKVNNQVENPCPLVMKRHMVDGRFECLVVDCKGVEYIYLWERYSTPFLVTSQIK